MRIAFVTQGSLGNASVRYRAAIPARMLRGRGYKVYVGPDVPADADVVVLGKAFDHGEYIKSLDRVRGKLIVDVCDWHAGHEEKTAAVTQAMDRADEVVVSTASLIAEIDRPAVVVPDPFEMPEREPGTILDPPKLLWFGHNSNSEALKAIMPTLEGYDVTVVSDAWLAERVEGVVVWSPKVMRKAFRETDITIIPTRYDAREEHLARAQHKSANRAVEAIRQGHLVVAHPLKSYEGIPGVIITDDIREGIEEARERPESVRDEVLAGQRYVAREFSPRRIATIWEEAIRSVASRQAA